MWRVILIAMLSSISAVSDGAAQDPGLGALMADPSDPIRRAPIGHRQPTPRDLVVRKPGFDGTIGANLRDSDADKQIDALDREIMEEDKEVDRMISGICRGC